MWSNRFVGLPYAEHGRARAGADCWGLVTVVYREELGITLPDYLGYASVDEIGEVAALIAGAREQPVWVPQSGVATAFDVAVFRRGRLDTHIGIVVEHGLMLHMAERQSASIASYETGRWRHRLSGIYRHVDLISMGSRA